MGLLRIHIQKGVNLAVRDMRSSDPYVVVKMGKQVIYMDIHFAAFNFWNCFRFLFNFLVLHFLISSFCTVGFLGLVTFLQI